MTNRTTGVVYRAFWYDHDNWLRWSDFDTKEEAVSFLDGKLNAESISVLSYPRDFAANTEQSL